MLSTQDIDRLIGIEEAYQLPEKLMQTMMDAEARENLFRAFLDLESDLSFDWFTDYFQSEHGDRDKLKQDYTPDCVCEILARMAGRQDSFLDLCAGCGGLTIKVWRDNPSSLFVCEELSSRVLPILLFNLAIRNMDALVLHGDSLQRDYSRVFRLTSGEQFSKIAILDDVPDFTVGCVISNPPYSLKWQPKEDSRWDGYGVAPGKAADYAFVLHGLSRLRPEGKALFILPHGVLFRGNAEEKIRKALLEKGRIRTIIGLPEKLFLYTGIPVCIMELTKSAGDGVFFVDAAKDFDKAGKQNRMNPDHIARLLEALGSRTDVERYASMAGIQKLEDNGYNLNIPRYVDTFEPVVYRPIAELFAEAADIETQIHESEQAIFECLRTLTGFSFDDVEAMRRWMESCGCRASNLKRSLKSKEPKVEKTTQQTLF